MNLPTTTLRQLTLPDCPLIAAAFAAQGWHKPEDQYQRYWQESRRHERDVLLAEYGGEFAGYLTIVWQSDYPPFRQAAIPEIVDFNVLIKFRRLRIGSALMDEAEQRIAALSPVAGIGVGLEAGYGAAQVLYARRGYVPDGRGIVAHGVYPHYGEQITIDDDLVLYLTKKLS